MLSIGQNTLGENIQGNRAEPEGFAARRDLMISRFFWPALITLAVIVYFIAQLMAVGDLERATDFQIFHKVGELFWQGHIGTAYHLADFTRIEAAATGQQHIKVSWAYPPQFDLVAAVLGAGPIIPMYLGFILASFGAYLAALLRLGARRAGWVLAFAFPALFINAATGQNGYMTGALVGWFAVAWLRKHAKAGIPLGLMIIKPHLVLGLAVLVLMRRRFGVIGWAAASAAVSGLLATMVFGVGIWGEFLHGAREASSVLQAGHFRFFRMTSVYTAARTLGVSFDPAMALQVAVAVAAFLALWWLIRARVDEEVLLGVAVLSTLLVSPYVYDYDLPIFGVGLALLVPVIARSLRAGETLLLWAAAWIVCGWGVGGILVTGLGHAPINGAGGHPYPSVSGVIYPLLVLALVRVATRDARGELSPQAVAERVA